MLNASKSRSEGRQLNMRPRPTQPSQRLASLKALEVQNNAGEFRCPSALSAIISTSAISKHLAFAKLLCTEQAVEFILKGIIYLTEFHQDRIVN